MSHPSGAVQRVGAGVQLVAPLALASRNETRTVRVGAEDKGCGGSHLLTVEKAHTLSCIAFITKIGRIS